MRIATLQRRTISVQQLGIFFGTNRRTYCYFIRKIYFMKQLKSTKFCIRHIYSSFNILHIFLKQKSNSEMLSLAIIELLGKGDD